MINTSPEPFSNWTASLTEDVAVGGLLWLALPATEEIASRLHAITGRLGGHATLFRAGAEPRRRLSVFEPESAARVDLTRAVKAAFDPKHILNPGRMYKDI